MPGDSTPDQPPRGERTVTNDIESGRSVYRDAGVDIDKASAAVERLKAHAHATFTASGAAAPIGHFGGVFRLGAGGERLLVASADGIGTKIKLAFVLGGAAHARVGADRVNHCINDILACGARPLFFLDYVAMGRLEPDVLVELVGGMASACTDNGTALIGGETAEMPGLYADGEYDAAGFIVGMVEPELFIDGRTLSEGDVLLGLPSAGLHTNGYSLARKIAGVTGDAEHDLPLLAEPLPGGNGETTGEALMAPHRSYLAAVTPALDARLIKGMAHITGGGLIDNLPRMLPEGLGATLDRTTWSEPPIFSYLVAQGEVPLRERYQVFNMGLGFVTAVSASNVEDALMAMPESRVIGQVVAWKGDRDRVGGLA
jgi:phosphoribosylformylglycinamidine cyclo-ligase